MNLFADIEESRAAVRIDARHAPIADRGKKHGYHSEQNHSDDVATRHVIKNAEDTHGRRGLNENDAVKHQVPKAQTALQANWSGLGVAISAGHASPQYRSA